MKYVARMILLLIVALPAFGAETAATLAARALLETQRLAWNRGDLEGFMSGYWNSDEIRFAGGDTFKYGWQATLESYRKNYPDASAMGSLDFELVETRELTPELVYVFGRWHLSRSKDEPDKSPHGLFTLLIERKNGQWFITRDHSSAAPSH